MSRALKFYLQPGPVVYAAERQGARPGLGESLADRGLFRDRERDVTAQLVVGDSKNAITLARMLPERRTGATLGHMQLRSHPLNAGTATRGA